MPDPTERPPVPDPTTLTTDQLLRVTKAERDYVDGKIAVLEERLRGIDVATVVLNDTLTQVPTDVQKEVGHLRELTFEKFASVTTQFTERDVRSERESKDNKVAVDAAFAAADKAADERNKSNSLAISKSETATAETIAKLNELFRTSIDALSDKLDDLKDRVGRIESNRQGAAESKASARLDASQIMGIIGTIIAVVSIGLAIMLAVGSGGP